MVGPKSTQTRYKYVEGIVTDEICLSISGGMHLDTLSFIIPITFALVLLGSFIPQTCNLFSGVGFMLKVE